MRLWMMLMMALVPLALADPAPPGAPAATPVPSAATNAVATHAAPPRIPAGDPFAMRGAADGDGFVNAGPAAIPAGIRVAGILVVANKKPVAGLSIPGSPSLHFVREGEVIQVDRSSVNGAKGATDSQLYLLVKSITANQVEIAPRTRPHDVRIYR